MIGTVSRVGNRGGRRREIVCQETCKQAGECGGEGDEEYLCVPLRQRVGVGIDIGIVRCRGVRDVVRSEEGKGGGER